MKCNNCGYSLQIEYKLCPSCGTPNPYFKEHRENMERYSQAYKETQEAVISRTQKTAGVLVKFAVSLALIVASFIIFAMCGNTDFSEKKAIKKVQSNLDKYRAEYIEMEKSKDFNVIDDWFAANYLNKVPEFNDCLKVFNVCMYYGYIDAYVMEVSYEDYMENAIRDKEEYCESIVESYDMMLVYANEEAKVEPVNEGHMECIEACVAQTKVLIQGVFKLSDEQMASFDDVTKNERIGMLMENWPYEE